MHARKRDYARSFGMQFNYQNRRAEGWARSVPGFGKAYKASVKQRYPAFLNFSPYGEMLPNKQSFIDLNYNKLDAFGLPMARRQYVWGDNDKKIFADMQRWSVEILKAAGAGSPSLSNERPTNHKLGGIPTGGYTTKSGVKSGRPAPALRALDCV